MISPAVRRSRAKLYSFSRTTKRAAKLESPNVSTIINAAWPFFPPSVFKLVQANSYPLLSYKGGWGGGHIHSENFEDLVYRLR